MKYGLSFLFGLSVAVLSAQNGTHPVTLPEALDLALTNSAQLRKAKLDRQSFELRLREGRSAAYPQINAVVSLDAYPSLPTQLMPGEVLGRSDDSYVPVQFGQPWQFGGMINVDQALYSESARRMVPATNVSRTLFELLTEKAEDEVVFQTATVFFQFLQAEAALRTVDANLHKISELERMVSLQVSNDYAVPTDVKRLRVAYNNLNTQKQNLLAGIAALRQTLQFLCGVPYDSPFDPVWTDIAEPGADSTRWLSIPLEPENTTENRLLLHNIELNRIRANSLRAEAYPSLGAYANLGFQTWREDANFLDTDHRWYGVAALGFRLRVPVFDGFKRRNQLALLGIDNQKLEEDRRQLVSARELEYRQARDQVQNNLFALKTQAENVRLAREISETTMLPYKEGTAPLSDLLNAQTALAEAETNYSQQTFVYRLSVLKLLKATGQLDLLRQQ